MAQKVFVIIFFLFGIASTLETASIHNAAMSGAAYVQYCLDQGTSIDERDSDGNTPLHYAALLGRFDVVQFLVNKGAQVNVYNRFDETPMDIAIAYKHFRMVTYLKIKGAYD